MKHDSLHNFFYPENILLIGASSKPRSIGYEILKSILQFGFKGKIFVVNPKSEEILGVKCFKSIEEISEEISLAIILVPKNLVFESLRSCASKRIKNVIIITAGFREIGEEGARLEKQMIDYARENGIRIVGPNCMGIINTDDEIKLNATFAAEVPHYSPISFLSQSGALAAAVLNTIKETNYSFGQFISIGNKADVNENDLLEYWWKDARTKVITMYLESFEDGRKFFELSKKVTKDKPLIVLKAARTKSGTKAASSHTGALATQDDIVEAALRQCGVIRVNTIEEMFETSKALLYLKQMNGKRVAVLTNAGGPAILCIDQIEKNNLLLVELETDTINKLREILHPEASLKNPVDMLPAADAQTYRKALKILSEDENVDAIITIFVEPVMIEAFDVIKELVNEQSINPKPILIVTFPLPEFWQKWKSEGKNNAVILKSVELAPVILKNLYSYQSRKGIRTSKSIHLNQVQKERLFGILNRIKQNLKESSFLTSKECYKILKTLDLPLPVNKFFTNKNELIKILDSIKFPCVLKISSSRLTHKSDVGGVALNIQNKSSLLQSFDQMQKELKRKELINLINEYEVQEYFNGEVEIIVGTYRDKSFGPIVNFGAGGKLVEIIKDKNLALAPISIEEAMELIENSKIYPLLKGYRDIKKTNIFKIAEIIHKISLLIFEFSEIKEIDLNPVIINGPKIKIVDYRISL